MGSSTENSAYGVDPQPVGHRARPGRLERAARPRPSAAGFAPLALGTDTGGSIRQPAALCGVVGMKPTYGAVSATALIAFASSLDQIGPFARTVRDCALCSAGDLRPTIRATRTSVEPARADRAADAPSDLDGVRLGVLAPTGSPGRRARRARGVRRGARAAARARGRACVETTLIPHARYALPAYYLIAPAEASANLARFDGVRYGMRVQEPGDIVADMYGRTRAARLRRARSSAASCSAPTRSRPATTTPTTAGPAGAHAASARDFDAAFAGRRPARSRRPRRRSRSGSASASTTRWAMYACDLLTVPVNLAGLPGISIPCGLSEGLPVGLPAGRPGVRREPPAGRRRTRSRARSAFDPRPPALMGAA